MRHRVSVVLRWWRDYRLFTAGVALLVGILVACFALRLVANGAAAQIGSAIPVLAPSLHHLLGTDTQGRDVLAELLQGTPQTLEIAFIAGIVGLAIGTVLGLLSGYLGGFVDTAIRTLSDSLMTIPVLAILVVIASALRTTTVTEMGIIIASLSWMYPLRAIRSQTLSLRERGYLKVARLNGLRGLELVIKQILPNLTPYIAASFVSTVSGAILFSVGLEALGLGPQNSYTLGTMIYWSMYYDAIIRGLWWWYLPPVILIAGIFVSLLMISIGLDPLLQRRPQFR